MLYHALSQLKVKNLGSGKHADGQGLWLIKRSKTAGKWILRLSVNGKRREMGLGGWPSVTISEARERAAAARKRLRDGVDPIEERAKHRRAAKPFTVEQAIVSCFESRKAELKGDGEAGRWMSPLRVHIIPKLGGYAVEDMDQHQIRETLEPIWHKKPEAARKALNRLNLAFKHAIALGLDVDIQAAMKARELLGKQRHKPRHIPSLPYSEAPTFYSWLTTVPGVTALALRFLILTVCRTSEVRLATFDEIEGNIWLLSDCRTKSGKDHRVPLTDQALHVVALARDLSENEFIFPSLRGKPLSDMAMSAFMKREGYEARPHGFRSTFRVWAEEQTDTPFEIKESALGHAVDSDIVRAYQRSDRLAKRKALMEQWSEFLSTPISV